MVVVSMSHRCFHPLSLKYVSAPFFFSHIPRPFQRFPFSDPMSWLRKSGLCLSWATETERQCQTVLQYRAQGFPGFKVPLKSTTPSYSQITRVHPHFMSHTFISQGLTYCRKFTVGYHACIYLKTRNWSEMKKYLAFFSRIWGSILLRRCFQSALLAQ